MRSFLFICAFAALAFFQTGCGHSASNTANDAPIDTSLDAASSGKFANITDPLAAIAEGNRLLDDNDTEEAIDAYKRAVELDPNLGEPYFKMGIAYALLENESKQSGGTQLLPGEVAANSKNQPKPNSVKMFEKAVAIYKKQLGDSSKDAAGYFNLGLAYNKLNQDDDAEDALAQAAKLKSDDSEYQTQLGAIRIKLAKFHEAITALKKAIEIDPDNSEAADLLEDAEAGAKRIDYVSEKPSDKKVNANSKDANANVAGDPEAGPGDSNTSTAPKKSGDNGKPHDKDQKTVPKDTKTEKGTAKEQKPATKPKP